MRSTLDLFGLFVHFGSIQSILSTSVLSGPHCFYSVHWVQSVHFGLIWSIQSMLVLFSPFVLIWSTLVHSILFGPPCSYSVHFILFGPFMSTSVHFCVLTYKEKTCLGLWVESAYSKSKFISIYIYISQTRNI